MKTLASVAAALALCACSAVPEAPDAPSYVIHNPALYATERPLVDDNGVSLAVVPVERARLVLPPAQDPFPWASGTSRVAD